MRLLTYNIAYGTGSPDAAHQRLWTIHRYLKTPRSHLDRIIKFIDESKADIVGLVEVDTGSARTNYLNQVETIANHLKHFHLSGTKYGAKNLLGNKVPILNRQGNAVLTREKLPPGNFHYFPRGFKKLIIEVDIKGIRFFLVHLALQKSVRKKQLKHLIKLVKSDGPVIIAGDFNTFSGPEEIIELEEELDLINPNAENLSTYPSWEPRKQLDFILCSREIKILDFTVPDVRYSDHLPLILDFEL